MLSREDNDMVVDEDGLPVPELDGSIPNIFAEPDGTHVTIR